MKVGFIGKGNVAQALAGVLKHKHHIRFGVRSPSALDQRTLADVAIWANVIILTAPWRAAVEIATEIASYVQGKPVIDATNPITMTGHGPDLTTETGVSAGEALQLQLPGAYVVKTFNQIGAEFMADAAMLTETPVMLAAANDDTAKQIAMTLIVDAGFEPLDAGPLSNARHIESLAMLWIWQAIKGPVGRNFGFALSHIKTERKT